MDARVEDCLLSGELLWAPAGSDEGYDNRELNADYPTLVPI